MLNDLKELFESQSADKFIPICRTESREECTPIFVKSKINIDMTDDVKFKDNFEELLRVIYNESKVKRPLIGKKPNFS